jgi:hypothetical protein
MAMTCSRRTFLVATAGVLAATYGARGAAAQDDAAGQLIIYADTVQGGRNLPEEQRADRACVLSSRYPRNSEIVWRARVIDPETGEDMDDTMLDTVEVTLSDGQTFEMHFGPHPPPPNPPRDYYWTTSWLIPADYATGTFSYTITATDPDGRTGEFKPFDVPSSLPTITDEVLSEVAPEGESTPAT